MRSAIRMTGGRETDLLRCGHHADDEGRRAHDDDGDQEGVFAADEIADAAEHQRAERAHQEARRERQQREDIARRFWKLTEELGADNGGQRTVKVEIIPLENRAERRGENDFLFFSGHWPRMTGGAGLRHGSTHCFRFPSQLRGDLFQALPVDLYGRFQIRTPVYSLLSIMASDCNPRQSWRRQSWCSRRAIGPAPPDDGASGGFGRPRDAAGIRPPGCACRDPPAGIRLPGSACRDPPCDGGAGLLDGAATLIPSCIG